MLELKFQATDKQSMADDLVSKAKELRAEAHGDRPLPKVWRVGMRIRYITHSQWGWDKGTTGVIIRTREEYRGKPAAEYQVFYTNSTGEDHPSLWTTPDDVELIPEDDKSET